MKKTQPAPLLPHIPVILHPADGPHRFQHGFEWLRKEYARQSEAITSLNDQIDRILAEAKKTVANKNGTA